MAILPTRSSSDTNSSADINELSTEAVDKGTATAKGDLYVATASGTIDKLAVGTNDQVLTADSTETSGVKWADGSGTTVNTTPTNSSTNAISSQWAYGVDGQRSGWRYEYNSTSLSSQASPVAGTWYNLGGSIGPFGANGEVWDISWTGVCYIAGSGLYDINAGLSTANNNMSTNVFKNQSTLTGALLSQMIIPMSKKVRVTLTGATTYYLNLMYALGSGTTLYLRGDLGQTQVVAQRIR